MSCNEEQQFTDVYVGNDHEIDLTDVASGDVELTSATITYQIYTLENEAVSGASGSLPLDGTGNDYSAVIDKDIIELLEVGNEYRIEVTGVQSNYNFEFNDYIRVKRRGRS